MKLNITRRIALPEYISNYDNVIPEDCFLSPCCGCGARIVSNQSTPICKVCNSFYE